MAEASPLVNEQQGEPLPQLVHIRDTNKIIAAAVLKHAIANGVAVAILEV